ncbi:glycerol-3-phosphate dehydrogenase, partial [Diaphorobacter sp. DS2]
MKIVVLGAGAWGTALAMSAAAHAACHEVTLWARDAQQAQAMQAKRQNQRYLPGLAFPPGLHVASGDMGALAADADLVVVGTPMAALRGMLERLD